MENIFSHPEFIALLQYPEIAGIYTDYEMGMLTENELIGQILETYSEMVYSGKCDLGCGWVNLLN